MRTSESDAAQIAVRIGNILKTAGPVVKVRLLRFAQRRHADGVMSNFYYGAGKPEYFDLAYFDQATGTFKWK